MTPIEKKVNDILSSVLVCLPGVIDSVDAATSFCNVTPIVFNKTKMPSIPSVPILSLGSSSKYLKFKSSPGDKVTLLFSQLDWGKYLSNSSTGDTENKEQFNLTSCIALPFDVHSRANNKALPATDWEIVGDFTLNGNFIHNGNTTQTGNTTTTGVITSPTVVASNSLTVQGVEQAAHVHSGVTIGNQDTNPVGT